MISICNCYGTGDFAPVLEIDSHAKLSSLNETKNKCKDVTAFCLFTNSSLKYSLFSTNLATRYRILFWGSGNHLFSDNMIVDNNETSQGIAFLEGNSTLTLSKCSFVNIIKEKKIILFL